MLYDFHNAKINYDPQFDLLSIRRTDCGVSYSLQFGSVIVDYYKNQPVAFEFSEAVSFLKKIFNYPKLNRELLQEIKSAKIGFASTQGNIIAVLVFVLPNKQQIEARYVLPQVAKQETKITA